MEQIYKVQDRAAHVAGRHERGDHRRFGRPPAQAVLPAGRSDQKKLQKPWNMYMGFRTRPNGQTITRTAVKPLTMQELAAACRSLAGSHEIFRRIHDSYGTPPLWDRPQGFTTLLQIILEQQVSLASAKACYDKLEARLGDVTPDKTLTLNDAEMREVGFSRQKASYARHLAVSIINGDIDITTLETLPDAEAGASLKKLKGVGDWTSDIYLLMALLRPDVMPRGDLALINSHAELSGSPRLDANEFNSTAECWRPYRSSAARLLWHFYLSRRAEDAARRSYERKTKV